MSPAWLILSPLGFLPRPWTSITLIHLIHRPPQIALRLQSASGPLVLR